MNEECKTWTRQDVLDLLANNDRAVARAILTLFQRQTAAEQSSDETREHNGVGFNSIDARFLSSVAKKLPQYGNRMTERQLVVARKMLPKYWRQLLDAIAEKGKPVDYKSPKARKHEIANSDTPEAIAPPASEAHRDDPRWGMF